MSVLMADMLCLDIGTRRASLTTDVEDLQRDQNQMESMLAGYVNKLNHDKKTRQFEEIMSHLNKILDRIGNSLSEVGISPELPPAQLDRNNQVWGAKAFAFRPPSACMDGSEHESNIEEKNKMWKLMEMLTKTAKRRDELLMEIMEWLTNIDTSTEGEQEERTVKIQGEMEETSMINMIGALDFTEQTLEKLKQLGQYLFGEIEDLDDISSINFNANTKGRINDRVGKASLQLDGIPKNTSANAMKSILLPKNLPDDVASLQASYNEEDEEEHKLMLDISKHWEEVSDEIRNIFISIHELRMIKRSTKLSLRRALYLFKLFVAVLELRSKELKAKETAVIKAKAEVNALSNKVEHLHRESKSWRERLNVAQSENSQLLAEVEDKENQLNDLQMIIKHNENDAADLKKQIATIEAEKQPVATTVVVEDPSCKDEANLELLQKIREQSSTIEYLEEKLERLESDHTHSLEREKYEAFKAKEHANMCEDMLSEVKMKLKVVEMRSAGLEDDLQVKNEDLKRMEQQLGSILAELKTKEEIISKMMGVPESEEPSDLVKKRRGSRRSSRRGSQFVNKKSSETVQQNPDGSSAQGSVDKRETSSFLDAPGKRPIMKVTSSKLLAAKHSRSKANMIGASEVEDQSNITYLPKMGSASSPHINEVEEVSFPVPAKPTPSPESADNVATVMSQRRHSLAMYKGERRGSINVTQTKEYKRLASELRASEKMKCELEIEVEELQRELEQQETEYERAIQASARQHKMQIFLEEGKYKSDTAKVYTESLEVQSMITSFKKGLASVLEKALLTAAARQAKSSFSYMAPVCPDNYLASMEANNKKYHKAFEILFGSISTAIYTMQSAQREMKIRSERLIGLETANHMKVLSEKTAVIERLSRQLENYREEFNQLKTSHHSTLKKNLELNRNLKHSENEKHKVINKVQELEDEYAISSKKGGTPVGKDAKKTKEALEVMLKYSKEQENKLKIQLAEVTELLEKEKLSRKRLEKAFILQQSPASSPHGEGALGITLNCTKPPKQQEKKQIKVSSPKAKSTTCRYIQTLNKFHELSEEMNNIDKNLINKSKQVTARWHNCVGTRFRMLVRKYLTFCRFQKQQAQAGKKVLQLRQPFMTTSMEGKESKKPQDSGAERRKSVGSEMKKLQADFWHLEMKKQMLTESSDKQSELGAAVKNCRHQVLTVFRAVAKAVIAVNKAGLTSGAKPKESEEKDTPNVNQDLLVPSNSMHSIASNSIQSATTNATSSPRLPKPQNFQDSEWSNVAVTSQSMIIKVKPSKTDHLQKGSTTCTNRNEEMNNKRKESLANSDDRQLQSASIDVNVSTNSSNLQENNDTPPHDEVTDYTVDQSPITTSQIENKTPHSLEINKNIEALSQLTDDSPNSNNFNSKYFARRFSHNERRHSVPITKSNPLVKTWSRRASLSASPKQDIVREIPRAFEYEVRHDLVDVRRGIQNTMEKSLVQGPSTSDLLDMDEAIDPIRNRQRRKTLAYLHGVKQDEELDVNDIVEQVKQQGNEDFVVDAVLSVRRDVTPEDSRIDELPRPSTGLMKKHKRHYRRGIRRPASVASIGHHKSKIVRKQLVNRSFLIVPADQCKNSFLSVKSYAK